MRESSVTRVCVQRKLRDLIERLRTFNGGEQLLHNGWGAQDDSSAGVDECRRVACRRLAVHNDLSTCREPCTDIDNRVELYGPGEQARIRTAEEQ